MFNISGNSSDGAQVVNELPLGRILRENLSSIPERNNSIYLAMEHRMTKAPSPGVPVHPKVPHHLGIEARDSSYTTLTLLNPPKHDKIVRANKRPKRKIPRNMVWRT
jgi:hypothetical protein